jgi:hypothetical protein
MTMINSTNKIYFFVVIIALALCLIAVGFLWHHIMTVRYIVYCQLIRPGMNKQEVTVALHTLGDYYEEGGPYQYFLGFKGNQVTRLAVGHMALLYDEQGKLIGVAKEVSIGDWGDGANCR